MCAWYNISKVILHQNCINMPLKCYAIYIQIDIKKTLKYYTIKNLTRIFCDKSFYCDNCKYDSGIHMLCKSKQTRFCINYLKVTEG